MSCGGSNATPDASYGSSPVTCAQSGGGASGTLVDASNLSHTFGPALTVTWRPPASQLPGTIKLDDGTTAIWIYGVACPAPDGNCPPPVGDYTDATASQLFDAPWTMTSYTPQTQDIRVDLAPPGDNCWGGRFDIVYSFDKGLLSGEIKGWWVNP